MTLKLEQDYLSFLLRNKLTKHYTQHFQVVQKTCTYWQHQPRFRSLIFFYPKDLSIITNILNQFKYSLSKNPSFHPPFIPHHPFLNPLTHYFQEQDFIYKPSLPKIQQKRVSKYNLWYNRNKKTISSISNYYLLNTYFYTHHKYIHYSKKWHHSQAKLLYSLCQNTAL